ncbi:MAG: tRNA (adenosine(37)-N6)-threonylcarbamoyltransferase complex dimerization subunit type 1 TsaB [Anderseniella sp.]|nr:tRNA (adenosine(37)-N6)-threonylcarbamoyltransferase complex dimerization subunit type 1 TsaB [Anderseniella sp.]
MLILAVDTAHAACSACVYEAATGKALASASEPMRQGHAERLPGLVEEVLQSANKTFRDIDRLAACSGPGTFTGVRIGLAFVRGLALVLNVPVIGITTFEALAASAQSTMPGSDCWVIQDARRGEVYVQGFGPDGKPLGEAQVLDRDTASTNLSSASGLAIGSGIELVSLSDAMAATALPAIPDIEQIARLAADAEPGDGPPSAFYLRAPDAKAQAPLVKHAAADITIEQAGAHHAAILATLHAASFEEGWNAAQFADLVNAPGSLCLLALAPDSQQPYPCGFVLARKAADEMEIITIAVLPAMRRRGVARRLLDGLREAAGKAGVKAIFIEYATDNPAAQSFYSRTGFAITGRRRNYYKRAGGLACDAITARLDL